MKLVALAVTSLDGYITRGAEPGSAFASREDEELFRATVRRAGAVIMGRRTFDPIRRTVLRNIDSGLLRVVVTREPERYEAIARPGALEFSSAAPEAIVADLAARGFALAVLGGGAATYDLFARARLIDEWWITVEPFLFGSGTSLTSFTGHPPLRLLEARPLNDSTVLLRYRLVR